MLATLVKYVGAHVCETEECVESPCTLLSTLSSLDASHFHKKDSDYNGRYTENTKLHNPSSES